MNLCEAASDAFLPWCEAHGLEAPSFSTRTRSGMPDPYVLGEQTRTDLDSIIVYVAEQSGSVETAFRVNEKLHDAFRFLAANPPRWSHPDRHTDPGEVPRLVRLLLPDHLPT